MPLLQKLRHRAATVVLLAFASVRVWAADGDGHDHAHGGDAVQEIKTPFQPAGPRLGERAITLPLLVADRHLAIAVTVYDAFGKKERITLALSLDNPDCITLHADQIEWLQVPLPRDGSPGAPLGFSFGDGELMVINAADISVESDSQAVEDQMNLTIRHASELQEQKLKGRIGLKFLRKYDVELDVAARELRLAPRTGGARAASGEFLLTFDESAGVIAVPLAGSADQLVVIGSARPETRISPEFARENKRPAGNLDRLLLSGRPALDLAPRTAFRPKPLGKIASSAAGRVVAVTGSDFLDGHRVVIDWDSSTIALTMTKPVSALLADQAFFAAEVAATTAALNGFLELHAQSHFAREAAGLLMSMRLSEWGASDDEILSAFRWLLETMNPERRIDAARPVVEQLSRTPGQTHLALEAGRLALQHTRAAISVQNVFRLHRVLGVAYLQAGDLQSARRHLISATFTKIPTDRTHTFQGAYYLGEVYERQGRLARAYSRYRAALATERLPENLRAQAEAALARVRGKLPADEIALLDEQ
jgi:hypothetical protein